MTEWTCQQCGRAFRKAQAFCSRACGDTWRDVHGQHGKVPIVPVLAALAPLLEVEPPLTPEEIARAAVFVLTGMVMDVRQAVEAVKRTPWPLPLPDDDTA